MVDCRDHRAIFLLARVLPHQALEKVLEHAHQWNRTCDRIRVERIWRYVRARAESDCNRRPEWSHQFRTLHPNVCPLNRLVLNCDPRPLKLQNLLSCLLVSVLAGHRFQKTHDHRTRRSLRTHLLSKAHHWGELLQKNADQMASLRPVGAIHLPEDCARGQLRATGARSCHGMRSPHPRTCLKLLFRSGDGRKWIRTHRNNRRAVWTVSEAGLRRNLTHPQRHLLRLWPLHPEEDRRRFLRDRLRPRQANRISVALWKL